MSTPRVAVISFPGNNCEVETIRSINRCGMQAVPFRWNDDVDKLRELNAYFFPGGFSYEDRGRAGMITARSPLMDVIREEASQGKVVVGNCNGAQVLVESGLIPLNQELKMSLAKNVNRTDSGVVAPGFLNEWVHIKVSCRPDRCACSNWDSVMHIPIAHGEGRFTTKNPEVIEELKENDQIAFSYCDEHGEVSPARAVTPNGSQLSIAGICNPEGNVVALMPHPERTPNGDPYFHSIREWIQGVKPATFTLTAAEPKSAKVAKRKGTGAVEIYVDTIIVNNEERTVEQAARAYLADITLKQMKFFSLANDEPQRILDTISLFNPNKEVAYLKRGDTVTKWDPDEKREQSVKQHPLTGDVVLVRRDEPDTGAAALGEGNETGVCYICRQVDQDALFTHRVLEIFANPHASTLEQVT